MSTELLYLFLTSVLLGAMWIPHIVGQAMWKGPPSTEEYRTLRDSSDAPLWVKRANRAHVNLVEQFGAFAGIVIVGHLAGVSNEVTVWCAGLYFWLRVAHAVVMISGTGVLKIRTMIFTVSFIVLMVYAWQIAAAKLF